MLGVFDALLLWMDGVFFYRKVNFGPSGVRALADIVATKLGIILSSSFFLPSSMQVLFLLEGVYL